MAAKRKVTKPKSADASDRVAAAASTNLRVVKPTTDLHITVPSSTHSSEDKAFMIKVISLLFLLFVVSAAAIWLSGSDS